MNGLKGKVAMITGGGSGIGAAVTERFIAEGARVCITGRRKGKLEEEAGAFPKGSVVTVPGDVSSENDVTKIVDAALTINGKIDILVNNAATDIRAPLVNLPLADWQRVLEVNLTGPFMMMKAIIPLMIKNGGGSIINISSVGGLKSMPGATAYGASKAGLISLTQHAALEYGPNNVRCNVICPGATRTSLLEDALGGMANEMKVEKQIVFKRFTSPLPLKRVAKPGEIAGVCYFLASEDSSFMTGAVLIADGGAYIVEASGAALSQ